MDDPAFYTQEQRDAIAEDLQAWVLTYMRSGFSRAEAMQMITRTNVVFNTPGIQVPPEQAELYERLNALLTRQLAGD